jgi:hypothetical protein
MQLLDELATGVIERLKAQGQLRFEQTVREKSGEWIATLFDRIIPQIRESILSRIEPDPPPNFQDELNAIGWTNFSDDQARLLWGAVFRSLANARTITEAQAIVDEAARAV